MGAAQKGGTINREENQTQEKDMDSLDFQGDPSLVVLDCFKRFYC
jgi:hypothetical protein